MACSLLNSSPNGPPSNNGFANGPVLKHALLGLSGSSMLTDRGGQNRLQVIGAVPEDPEVFEAGLEGRQLEWGKALDAAAGVLDRLIIQK